MFAATRRWFRRNRTPIAIGLGVVGAGYVATQYILNKLNDARERMSSDRIAKEKCALSSSHIAGEAIKLIGPLHLTACGGASSRTRRTARIPC